jgi:hypothetical protein
MSDQAFDHIPVKRLAGGELQGICPWCKEFMSPPYKQPKQVINSVRKHMKKDHKLSREDLDGQSGERESDVAAPE